MIDIDGKYYKIDMDAAMKWVTENPSSERNINVTTTLTYPVIEGEEVVEKEISENKSTLNDVMCNVRYDLIRTMLNTLLTTFTNDLNHAITMTFSDLSFSQKLAFNTLLTKGIIQELK